MSIPHLAAAFLGYFKREDEMDLELERALDEAIAHADPRIDYEVSDLRLVSPVEAHIIQMGQLLDAMKVRRQVTLNSIDEFREALYHLESRLSDEEKVISVTEQSLRELREAKEGTNFVAPKAKRGKVAVTPPPTQHEHGLEGDAAQPRVEPAKA